jgi:hypothetical protein
MHDARGVQDPQALDDAAEEAKGAPRAEAGAPVGDVRGDQLAQALSARDSLEGEPGEVEVVVGVGCPRRRGGRRGA